MGMSTDREHLPLEVASIPREDKVITLGTAKTGDGSVVDLYVEESAAGRQVQATREARPTDSSGYTYSSPK